MLVNGRSWGLPRRVSSAVATCALIISSGVAFGVVGSPGVAGADVNVGRNPVAVAVDDATGIAYIANEAEGTISVDDGTSVILPKVTLNNNPQAIAVNATTDMVYTANESGTVSVVDASTKTLSTSIVLPNALSAQSVAVNTTTNTIYVEATNPGGNGGSPVIDVINGATNAVTATITMSSTQGYSGALAVNSSTNTVYVGFFPSTGNHEQPGIDVISGATNAVTTTISLSAAPSALVVNPTNNSLFAAESGANLVADINGATNQITTTITAPYGVMALGLDTSSGMVYALNLTMLTYISPSTPEVTHVAPLPSGSNPSDLAVDSVTHQLFITNTLLYQLSSNTTGSVSVLDDTLVTGIASVQTGSGPSSVAFNPNTNTAYVVNQYDGTLSVINLTTNTDTATLNIGTYPGEVAVNPTTNTFYVTSGGFLDVFNGANNALEASVVVASGLGALAVNSVTNMVYVGVSTSSSIQVINGATNALVTTITGAGNPSALAVNTSTNTLYATTGTGQSVVVINGATNTVTTTIALGRSARTEALNAATNTLVVGDLTFANNLGTHLSVINTLTNTVTATIPIGAYSYSIVFGPTANSLYTFGSGAVVGVNLATDTATSPDYYPSGSSTGAFYDPTTGTYDVTMTGGTSTASGTGPMGLGLISPLPTPVISGTTPGNTFANVSVTPAPDGGLPIDTYTVTATDLTTPANGGQVATSATSPIEVTGLTNGDHYTFTVTTTNALGTTAASAASSVTIPATVPGAPTGVSATAGNQQAVVSFTAPASTGGSAITSYTVKATDLTIPLRGGQVVSGSSSPITVTGLSASDSYTFTVTATNIAGTGAASSASASVSILGPPSAPQSVTATAGEKSATVSFIAPQYNNGEPVTSYTVTATDATTPANGGETATGASSPIVVTGLTDGDSYTFTVTATNLEGAGAASAASNAVIPKFQASKPPAPTNVTVVPKDCGATVSFSPPSTDNGSTITRYIVYVTDLTTPANGGQQETGPSSPISFCGLTDGDQYTVTVAAQNAYGVGPQSAASAVFVPNPTLTVPGAPTGVLVSAINNGAKVYFTPPSSNGNATITSYTVTANDVTTSANGGETASGASSPITITGLTNGDTYNFTVVATNSVGSSVPSTASSNIVINPPAGKAPPPTNIVVTPKDCGATVSFSPPSTNNGSTITSYQIYLTDLTTPANGGQEEITTSSPYSFCGLTDGDQYTLTMASVNGFGAGTASAPSAVFVPMATAVAPNAPTGVVVSALNQSARVYFTPPVVDGGSTITSYTVTAHDLTNAANGGQTVSGASSPLVITGLTNGDSYNFTVTATNAVGTGPASTASSTVVPLSVGPPDAPTNVVATAGLGSATVTWTPGFDEGSAITSFTVNSSGGQQCLYTVGVSAGTNTCTFTGLPSGTYTFTVRATNAKGTGLSSAASVAITVLSVPGAPTAVTVVPGNGQVTVSWAAPTSTGGSAITSYTVTSSPGGKTCTYVVGTSVGTRTCTVLGLTNSTHYTFTVTATTAVGTGAASAASASVTPLATDAHITSAATYVVSQGGHISWALTATGTTPTSSSAAWFSVLGAPSFVTLSAGRGTSANTGTLTGTAPRTPGVYNFDVIAVSPRGTRTVQSVTLTVLGFTSATSATFTVGTRSSVTITTNDPHASVTTTSHLPAGIRLVNNHNGTATLVGTPTSTTGSPFTIVITATDGSATATQTFHLTVH